MLRHTSLGLHSPLNTLSLFAANWGDPQSSPSCSVSQIQHLVRDQHVVQAAKTGKSKEQTEATAEPSNQKLVLTNAGFLILHSFPFAGTVSPSRNPFPSPLLCSIPVAGTWQPGVLWASQMNKASRSGHDTESIFICSIDQKINYCCSQIMINLLSSAVWQRWHQGGQLVQDSHYPSCPTSSTLPSLSAQSLMWFAPCCCQSCCCASSSEMFSSCLMTAAA